MKGPGRLPSEGMVTKPAMACSLSLLGRYQGGPRGQAAPAGVIDYCKAWAVLIRAQVRFCFPVKCQPTKPLHDLTLTMFEGGGEPTLKADLCLSNPSPAQRDTPLPLQREGTFSYKASTKHLELAGSQSHSITTYAFIWEGFSFTRLNA